MDMVRFRQAVTLSRVEWFQPDQDLAWWEGDKLAATKVILFSVLR